VARHHFPMTCIQNVFITINFLNHQFVIINKINPVCGRNIYVTIINSIMVIDSGNVMQL